MRTQAEINDALEKGAQAIERGWFRLRERSVDGTLRPTFVMKDGHPCVCVGGATNGDQELLEAIGFEDLTQALRWNDSLPNDAGQAMAAARLRSGIK